MMEQSVVSQDERFGQAEEMLQAGDEWGALKLLLELIEEDPNDAMVVNKAGVAYARMEDFESAEQCFLDAILLDYRNTPALSNLGNIYLSRGELGISVALYNKALKYNPDYSVAHNNIAAAYKRMGKVDKQVNHFKRSQKLIMDRHTPDASDRLTRSSRRDPEQSDSKRTGGRFGWLVGLLVVVIIVILVLIVSS